MKTWHFNIRQSRTYHAFLGYRVRAYRLAVRMWLFALFPVFSIFFVWFFLPVGVITSVAWMLFSSLNVSHIPTMFFAIAVAITGMAILGPITARTLLSLFSDYFGVVALMFGNKVPLEKTLSMAEAELEQWETHD